MIVVLYHNLTHPMVESVRLHLDSFRKYSTAPVVYWNVAQGGLPKLECFNSAQLFIFHTTLLSKREKPLRFSRILHSISWLAEINVRKVMFPQDEYYFSDSLVSFARKFHVSTIYSVMPSDVWPIIYPFRQFECIEVKQTLTSFIDDRMLDYISEKSVCLKDRDIVLGYRAWQADFSLGDLGQLKRQIGQRSIDILEKANVKGKVDISTHWEDRILGEQWYDFLLASKVTVGCEGGSSVLDRAGEVRRFVARFMDGKPNASYREIRSEILRNYGDDILIQMAAISPRHMEACLTRTVQVLVEGDYSGILKPYIHYLPVKRDFSDLESVLSTALDGEHEEMLDRAYSDVITSKKYNYETFVKGVIGEIHELKFSFKTKVIVLYVLLRERGFNLVLKLSSPFYYMARRYWG